MTMSTGLPESDGRASSTFEMNGGHEDRGFARIGEAIEAIGRGEIVIVVDDEDRENEGDLIMMRHQERHLRLAKLQQRGVALRLTMLPIWFARARLARANRVISVLLFCGAAMLLANIR